MIYATVMNGVDCCDSSQATALSALMLAIYFIPAIMLALAAYLMLAKKISIWWSLTFIWIAPFIYDWIR